jgi:hypothetical protein
MTSAILGVRGRVSALNSDWREYGELLGWFIQVSRMQLLPVNGFRLKRVL